MEKHKGRLPIKLLVALMVMVLFACTTKPPLGPSIEEPVEIPGVDDKTKRLELQDKTEVNTLLELALSLEGDILQEVDQGFKGYEKTVEALRLYAKALKISDQEEEVKVRGHLDRFLATVDDAELERLSGSEFIEIPRAEVLYRLGLNYGAKGENQAAMDTLARFLKEYPDHLNGDNARQVLLLVQEQLFRKNTVGFLLPMSGRFSIFGERALKGIQLAVQDLDHWPGYDGKIKVMIKDTRSDDAHAATLVRKLAAQKVAGLAGAIITSDAAARAAQQSGIPLITMTQKSQVAKIGDCIFSNFLTPEIQTQALASYALRVLNVERFAILYPDDKYGITHMNFFRDKINELGGKIVGVESYGKDQTDFSGAIKKLIKEFPLEPVEIRDLSIDSNSNQEPNGKFDGTSPNQPLEKMEPSFYLSAFFIPDSPSKVGMILPQLAYHDVTGAYLLGTNLWHDGSLIRDAEKYARKAVITDGFFAGGSNQRATDFAHRFEALFGEAPGFIEAVAYDTLMILAKTALESGVNSRNDLKNALAGQRIFEGVTGRTMFDPDGNAQKELVFITIRRGAFHEIER